jgi:hypothetical protein
MQAQMLEMRLSRPRYPPKTNIWKMAELMLVLLSMGVGQSLIGPWGSCRHPRAGPFTQRPTSSLPRGAPSLLFVTNTFTCVVLFLPSDKHAAFSPTLSRWRPGLLMKCALVAQERAAVPRTVRSLEAPASSRTPPPFPLPSLPRLKKEAPGSKLEYISHPNISRKSVTFLRSAGSQS